MTATPRVPSTAWNLAYETEAGASWNVRTEELEVATAIARPAGRPSGWTGQWGPGIGSNHWPRSPHSKLPMRHALTLWLPDEYLVRGPEFVGLAVFQGDDERDAESASSIASGGVPDAVGESDPNDPFSVQLANARAHPEATIVESSFAARSFAVVWLRRDELQPGPTPPPDDVRWEGEHENSGLNAWDDPTPFRRIWLLQRADPNVGIAPSETPEPDGGYRVPRDEVAGTWEPWAEPLRMPDHLGGTYILIDRVPALSPFYLQLRSGSGLQLGTTYAAEGKFSVDLLTGSIDWHA